MVARVKMALACFVALAAVACGAPRTGFLRVTGAPDDALVTIDDRYVGKLGRLKRSGIRLPEGEHRVTVEAPGHFPHDVIVRVIADTAADLGVTLQAIPD